jgi:hypothetical protein
VLHPSAVVGGATASELHVRDLMGHLVHVPNLILKKESLKKGEIKEIRKKHSVSPL